MPIRDHYAPGVPSWIDLMSPDVDTSITFYTSLFGWDAEDQHDDEGNRIYTMFRQGGHDIAGLGGQAPGMEGMPPVWNSYVATADCDATVEKAAAAGGSVIMPPMDVMESGKMAIVADPSGAMISLWQAQEHAGAGLVNEPNSFSWSELLSRQRDEVKGFYSRTFDWTFEDQDMGSMIYSVAKVGDDMVAGLMEMPAEMPDQVPDHWMVYFSVADTDAICEQATALGGQVVSGPMSIPGVGRIATLHDPQGGSFSVMQELDGES